MPGSTSPGLDRGSGQQPLFTKTKWWTGLVADGGKDDNVSHLEARPGDLAHELQGSSGARRLASRPNSSVSWLGPSSLAPVFWCRAAPADLGAGRLASSRVSPAAAAGKQEPYVSWEPGGATWRPKNQTLALSGKAGMANHTAARRKVSYMEHAYLAENESVHKYYIEMLSNEL